MSGAVEHAEHPSRSQPDLHDAVYSAELFDPDAELRILHRGRLYRLQVAQNGELELLGPMSQGMRSGTPRQPIARHPTGRWDFRELPGYRQRLYLSWKQLDAMMQDH